MRAELNKLAAEFNRYFTSSNGVDVPAKVSVSRDEWRALLTAIQQAQGEPFGYIHHFVAHDESGALIDTTWEADGCADALPHPTYPDSWKWSHSTPFYTNPAPGVPEFIRIAKRKLDELQEQGFAITGYAIQRGTKRGFITDGGFVGWWRSDEAPSVFLVRDVASLLRASVPDVCNALAELGYEPRRSTNAAISPDEAIAVAKRLNLAPGVPDDVVRDAERYRLLRRGQTWSVINGVGDTLRADDLDTAIDAAMLAASQAQKGGE